MGAKKTPTVNPANRKGPSVTDEKKARKHKKKETFSVYIYRVLKQVHEDTSISRTSMAIMNSFIYDLFDQIVLEASNLVRNSKKHTLSSREIKSSVQLILPDELAKHAMIEGTKAMNKYAQSTKSS